MARVSSPDIAALVEGGGEPTKSSLSIHLPGERFRAIVSTNFLQSASIGATMKHSNCPTQGRELRPAEPELRLSREGCEPDPRLIELARMLARRAARQIYEEQMKERGTKRS